MATSTATTTLRILCATWNVNGKPCKEDLAPWLRVPSDHGTTPDMVVVGLQEEDLRPEAYLTIDEGRINGWRGGIEAVLASSGDYVEVACCQLVGMVIIVYSTRQLCAHISDVDTAMVGCGYAGVMGNKGAVGVRFLLGGDGNKANGRSICFVNSHLNAHAHMVKRRQEDYESICSRMVFFSEQPLSAVTPPNNLEALKSLIAHDTEDAGPALSPSTGADDAKPSGRTTPAGPSSDDPDVLRPLEHDLVIWLGDLNYRLDLTREEILAAAKATEWEKLHASDQLRQEMAAGNVFQGFNEAPPRFWPTYKFDSGTDQYDTSAKQRVPAHCDRILWRVNAAPSNHRSHRPSSAVETPPLATGDGYETSAPPPTPSDAPRPSGPPAFLVRAPSSLTIVAGTGTAKHINPALAGSASSSMSLVTPTSSSTAPLNTAGSVNLLGLEDLHARRRSPAGSASGSGAAAAASSRRRTWRASDITVSYYRMHMDLRVSDHKPVSALLVADLGITLGKREVDEDTLEMPAGGKVARRVAVGGANRKRNHLFDIAGMLVRKSVRSYKFWLAVGLVTGLIVYYAWRR